MRNGSILVARPAVVFALIVGVPFSVAAQEDLLDFGDSTEQEKPADEPEPEPEPTPEPEPEEPIDEPAIDEPADIDEPAVDEPDEPGDTDTTAQEPTEDTESPAAADSPARLDKIKAVPRKAVLKKGRIELAPFASLSMNDAFYQHLAIGGSITYFPHDSFGFGVGVDYLYA
ncbi:MAG: hypothetical protein AAF658_15205, partial [Myxococcota bacterium]